MTSQSIPPLLTEIFRDVFKDPALVLEEAYTATDLPAWDSMNHVILIGAIETRFGTKFKLKELMSIESVGDIVRLLAAKGTVS